MRKSQVKAHISRLLYALMNMVTGWSNQSKAYAGISQSLYCTYNKFSQPFFSDMWRKARRSVG